MSGPAPTPIGSPLHGGKYAGMTTGPDGVPYALILLPDKPPAGLAWPAAVAWADNLQAQLPNRVEGALLFANLRADFEPRWHWLSEQYSERHAWLQGFDNGGQYNYVKSYEGRARAVRRLVLESFSPSAEHEG